MKYFVPVPYLRAWSAKMSTGRSYISVLWRQGPGSGWAILPPMLPEIGIVFRWVLDARTCRSLLSHHRRSIRSTKYNTTKDDGSTFIHKQHCLQNTYFVLVLQHLSSVLNSQEGGSYSRDDVLVTSANCTCGPPESAPSWLRQYLEMYLDSCKQDQKAGAKAV